MDRIKKAQLLAEKILDDCKCGPKTDQVKIAQNKDTLFDNNKRIVKDKVDDEPSLNPVPTTETKKLVDEKVDNFFNKMKRSKINKQEKIVDECINKFLN